MSNEDLHLVEELTKDWVREHPNRKNQTFYFAQKLHHTSQVTMFPATINSLKCLCFSIFWLKLMHICAYYLTIDGKVSYCRNYVDVILGVGWGHWCKGKHIFNWPRKKKTTILSGIKITYLGQDECEKRNVVHGVRLPWRRSPSRYSAVVTNVTGLYFFYITLKIYMSKL